MQRQIKSIRSEFPIFAEYPNLKYFDSSTTTQRPQSVIDAISEFYSRFNANTGRGNYKLAEMADNLLDESRMNVAKFVGVKPSEIIFTGNITASINMVAYMMLNSTLEGGDFRLDPQDEIVVTLAEHHANLIPWQKLAEKTGAQLKYIGLAADGRIDASDLSAITPRTKIVAFSHLSNVTGAISEASKIIEAAHKVGAIAVMDACQSVPHIPVNFAQLDIDFAGFSGHKMFSGFGVGVLYGKEKWLNQFDPVFYGGGIVNDVQLQEVEFNDSPMKFESGTKNLEGIYSLSAAIDFIESIGLQKITDYESELTGELLKLQEIDELKILGPLDRKNRAGAVSFVIENVHPHDAAQYLDHHDFCVRAGHHCAKPLHTFFGVPASTRASIGIYNSADEVHQLIDCIKGMVRFFK